jgi:hypothetical protein
MKYNKNIERKLEELVNDEVRIASDVNSKRYIHDNQINAAKEIVKSFTAHLHPEDEHEARNNHVVLVAKMQSGKTGTCNATINILEKTNLSSYFNIEKYLYVTGMNDNGLHKQTVDRLYSETEGQVIGASLENVCDGDKESKEKPNAKYFVQKNSDLRKNNIKLSNCLIFIDESHFGSNKTNVLTKFLEENGINWKNTKTLKEKHIYIVSVSATPFDEIVSDIVDCKTIVELQTNELYVGVSEYLEKECILPASKNDFKEDKITKKIPLIEHIKEIYLKIKENNNRGVLFIRTRDVKIKGNQFIRDNFKIIELDAKRGGSIDYDLVYNDIQAMIDSTLGSQTNKPIIFFVKGAYRAGITLNQEHKDYVYLVYDNSSKAEATAQGLLGRMCGYRKSNTSFSKTLFIINKQHAEDYAEWEEDFKNKSNIPTTRKWIWVADDYKETDVEIATKCNGNFEIPLTDEQVIRFAKASLNKDVKNKEFAKNELRLLKPDFTFDYFGEAYISGKNAFSITVVNKWFDNFEHDKNCPSYRPDLYFKEKNNGRDVLSIPHDLGKIICHVVLDSDVYTDEDKNILKIDGNKRLLVYHGILSKKAKVKSDESLIKEHKKTS